MCLRLFTHTVFARWKYDITPHGSVSSKFCTYRHGIGGLEMTGGGSIYSTETGKYHKSGSTQKAEITKVI